MEKKMASVAELVLPHKEVALKKAVAFISLGPDGREYRVVFDPNSTVRGKAQRIIWMLPGDYDVWEASLQKKEKVSKTCCAFLFLGSVGFALTLAVGAHMQHEIEPIIRLASISIIYYVLYSVILGVINMAIHRLVSVAQWASVARYAPGVHIANIGTLEQKRPYLLLRRDPEPKTQS